jgi:hypothetical protein
MCISYQLRQVGIVPFLQISAWLCWQRVRSTLLSPW